jgi:hypothetical protein
MMRCSMISYLNNYSRSYRPCCDFNSWISTRDSVAIIAFFLFRYSVVLYTMFSTEGHYSTTLKWRTSSITIYRTVKQCVNESTRSFSLLHRWLVLLIKDKNKKNTSHHSQRTHLSSVHFAIVSYNFVFENNYDISNLDTTGRARKPFRTISRSK